MNLFDLIKLITLVFPKDLLEADIFMNGVAAEEVAVTFEPLKAQTRRTRRRQTRRENIEKRVAQLSSPSTVVCQRCLHPGRKRAHTCSKSRPKSRLKSRDSPIRDVLAPDLEQLSSPSHTCSREAKLPKRFRKAPDRPDMVGITTVKSFAPKGGIAAFEKKSLQIKSAKETRGKNSKQPK